MHLIKITRITIKIYVHLHVYNSYNNANSESICLFMIEYIINFGKTNVQQENNKSAFKIFLQI